MDVVLLGTGASDAWPNAFCGCASCATARAAGEWRAPTAALVDGTLLLECGGGLSAAAARLGVALDGVRHVLVTHAHPDHWQPQVLAGRAWSTAGGEPVELVGPPAVVRLAREAGLRADTRVVRPGDRLRVGGYDVRVLAAAHAGEEVGPAVLYDVAGPGGRLLWATDTGPLPAPTLDAVAGAGYDAVLLDETYGDGPAYAGAAHHGLDTFATTVAELRRRGAVGAATRVLAVHLGHGNPPAGALAERLAPWGASAPGDGARLRLGADDGEAGAVPGAARRVLVIGGARSGKSAHAERLLLAEPGVTYLATAPAVGELPGDAEWARRVATHRARRPAAWRTVEDADLAAALRGLTGPALADCVSMWLTRLLDRCGAWADDAGPAVDAAVDAAVDDLLDAWRAVRHRVVAVTSEVGQGVVPATASGRRFRDDLGRLNARLAAAADEVWLVTAGIPHRLK